MRLLSYAPWLALLTIAALAARSADAMAAAPNDSAEDLAPLPPAPPRDLHLRFFLEPAEAGARTLVLRDDGDLRLPLGEVEPEWACDADVELRGAQGARVMQVACGGGALVAEVGQFYEAGVAQPLTASSSTGVEYTIPRDPGAKLALDSQLIDPAGGCMPGEGGTIDVSSEETPKGRGDAEYAPKLKLRVHSEALPIDSTIDAYDGEKCAVERDDAGKELVARCWYPHEPHEDIIDLRIRDGALLWTEVDRSICSGRSTLEGGWRLGCDATVQWPSAAKVFAKGDHWSMRGAPSDSWGVHYETVDYEP